MKIHGSLLTIIKICKNPSHSRKKKLLQIIDLIDITDSNSCIKLLHFHTF